MGTQKTLYPLEFFVRATPISLQASRRLKERWRTVVRNAARDRVRDTDDLGFLDQRPVSLSVYYFPAAPMEGDVDNIVKPIMDALIHVAYMDDRNVERVVVQKFEPNLAWNIFGPSDQLDAALGGAVPVVVCPRR